MSPTDPAAARPSGGSPAATTRSPRRPSTSRMTFLTALLAAVAALLVARPALAADSYVNQGTGSNSNSCLSAADPCLTISGAGGGVAKAGTNDDVHVAAGTYTEEVALGAGKSLRATGAAAATIIASPSTMPAISVNGAAGTIEGFTIRGQSSSFAVVRLEQNATLRGNVFDSDSAALKGDVWVNFLAGSAQVVDNTFRDPDIADKQTAISINTPPTVEPVIEGNQVSDYWGGVHIDRGTPLIRANEIAGTHAHNGSPGAAISASPAGNDPAFDSISPLVVDNVIRDGIVVGPNFGAVGVRVSANLNPGGATFGARLLRNRITSHSPGAQFANTDGEVTLNGDTIVGVPIGLHAFENEPGTLGDVTATNVTIVGGGENIELQHTHVTLDSSIIQEPVDTTPGPTATCTITHSRGPTTTPGGNGCADFQTAADPQFVNSPAEMGIDDLHLKATSPLIDAGNPAAPAAGILDVDGDPRALSTKCGWTARRDIGADEFATCTPAETEITSGPADGSLTQSFTAGFVFSNPVATELECSLDGAPFSSCTSPATLDALTEGPHTFAVRGRDAAGNVDLTPAQRAWTIDTTAPETQITSGPADGAVTQERSAAYGFSSEAGASFECSVDGGAYAPCGSPASLTGLGDGNHSFAVRATDPAGNVDPSPATRVLRVDPATGGGGQADGPDGQADGPDGQADTPDTDAPETTLRRPKVRGPRVTLRFSSDEAGSTFMCKLDKRKFRPCESPKAYRKLRRGRHKVRVVAIDAAGNRDATPARRSFRIVR